MCLNFAISFAFPSVVLSVYVAFRAEQNSQKPTLEKVQYGMEIFLRCLKFRNHFYNYYFNFGMFVAPQDEASLGFRREEGPAILINTFHNILSSAFTYLALTSDELYAIPAVLTITPLFSDRYFNCVEQLIGKYVCDRGNADRPIHPPFR